MTLDSGQSTMKYGNWCPPGRQRANALTPGCDAMGALRSQVHHSHRLLEKQVNLTMQHTRFMPGAESQVLSIYVHALCVEDAAVNVVLRKMRAVFESVWNGGAIGVLGSERYSRLRRSGVCRDGWAAGSTESIGYARLN